jgi:DNA polymerase
VTATSTSIPPLGAGVTIGIVESGPERREALREASLAARSCTRCPQLAATRTQVVFGAGNPDADLVLVGEAPGRDEDERGLPFVGRSGRLLDRLLGELGLSRDDVYVTNLVRCRPPQNRDPLPAEVDNCSVWLWRTLELVQPRVVCALGNFATKLLRGDPTGIGKLHGQVEVRTLGPRTVRLLPLFHPAAALYTPANVETLRADLAQLPGLLALPAPEQPAPVPAAAAVEPVASPGPAVEAPPVDDLRLF